MRSGVCAFLLLVACSGSDTEAPDAPAPDAIAAVDAPPDAAPRCPSPTAVSVATASEITVEGDVGSTLGIFDPSVVYPQGATAGAMAYSAVPTQETIRTRIAVSADHGGTWTYVAEPNTPQPAMIPSSDAAECPGGACSGNLISETASLIYDADDPDVSQRWKLFAHRYLVGPGVALHYRIGNLALQTASQPQGPWTAPRPLIGWTSPSAYSSAGVALNASTINALSDCIVLSEPSALWLPGSIQLAVGCVAIASGAPTIRIELLRSVDHGASWQYVSRLLTPADASCLTPGASLNGADLFTSGGTAYVAATPSDPAGYHGCLVYPLDDIIAGHVARDASGEAIVTRSIVTEPAMFSGACTFAEEGGGFAFDVGDFQQPRPFRMFRTGIAAP